MAVSVTPELLSGCEPLQPSDPVPPLAVQDVVLALVQLSVGAEPGWIWVGFVPLALIDTVGDPGGG